MPNNDWGSKTDLEHAAKQVQEAAAPQPAQGAVFTSASPGSGGSAGSPPQPAAQQSPASQTQPPAKGAEETPEQFVQATAGPLADALRSVQSVARAISNGDLKLDDDVAPRVLRALDDVLTDVDDLVAKASKLDHQPLLLGNNFVASVTDRRIQQAGTGEGGLGVIPLLRAFRTVVHGYDKSVRSALRAMQGADEDLAADMRKLHNESDVDGDRHG